MKKYTLFITFTFYSFFLMSQVSNLKEKFNLPNETKETSGLLFLNNKIITHNDSGDKANLYEIDSLSGSLLRTVLINNATNIDWEDISEDESHIYVADIGNNNGSRTNLKIYKILKSDFKESTSVSADVISYSYEDQTDFTSKPNSSNFDAEAIAVYDNSILIFTKNWLDLKTNVYKVPLTKGNHIATKVSSANIEGLITGSVYNNNRFFLTGYNTSLIPFLVYFDSDKNIGDDIFFSGFDKVSLENELGQGSQIEGITNIGLTGNYYISRENFTTTISKTEFSFPQKLYQFYDNTNSTLSVTKNETIKLNISPNPLIDKITINTNLPFIDFEIYNYLGVKVNKPLQRNQREIDLSHLSTGVYIIQFELENKETIIRKIIKL